MLQTHDTIFILLSIIKLKQSKIFTVYIVNDIKILTIDFEYRTKQKVYILHKYIIE